MLNVRKLSGVVNSFDVISAVQSVIMMFVILTNDILPIVILLSIICSLSCECNATELHSA